MNITEQIEGGDETLPIAQGQTGADPIAQALSGEETIAASVRPVAAVGGEAPERQEPGRLRVVTAVQRLVPIPILLRLDFGPDLDRVFLIRAGEEVRCGRAKPTRGDKRPNHLVLRLLPCRSKQRDPQNWNASMAISSTHMAFVRCHDGVRLLDTSRNGTMLDGRPLQKGVPVPLSEQFQIMIGGVLRLRGRVFKAKENERWTIECDAELPLAEAKAPDAAVVDQTDVIALKRVANMERDHYVLLYRQAVIGRDSSCAIQVDAEGIEPQHAVLLRHRGMIFLTPTEAGFGKTWVQEQAVAPGTCVPIGPGTAVRLGPLHFGVAASRPAELCTTRFD